MPVFETERLTIRTLEEKDKTTFVEIQTDPRIIDPTPGQSKNLEDVIASFKINLETRKIPIKGQDNIWGVSLHNEPQIIGLVAILTNELNEWEIGYRLKVNYWNQGYGTELTKGLIGYCLNTLKYEMITAVVDINNIASVRILEKFMVFEKEFYNLKDKCTDRKYSLRR